jgi:hypothetical protein
VAYQPTQVSVQEQLLNILSLYSMFVHCHCLRLHKRQPCSSWPSYSHARAAAVEHACPALTVLGCSLRTGMSMFTTKNGLYERARSKFKIQDGMKLFSYPFYKQRRKDLQVNHDCRRDCTIAHHAQLAWSSSKRHQQHLLCPTLSLCPGQGLYACARHC